MGFIPALIIGTLLLAVNVPCHSASGEYTVFIATKAVEVSSRASCMDLYESAKALGLEGDLMFSGAVLPMDSTLCADIGICAEAVVDVQSIPLWKSLYLLASQFENRERLKWWRIAQSCNQEYNDSKCSDATICGGDWDLGLVRCDGDHRVTFASLDSSLSGHLEFNALPQSVIAFGMCGQMITSVDFSGLRGKSCWSLRLVCNEIRSVNLTQLVGTKVDRLDVTGNPNIQWIDVKGVEQTNLQRFDLYDEYEDDPRYGKEIIGYAVILNFDDQMLDESHLSAESKQQIREIHAATVVRSELT